jgi:hypothetical protein
LLRVLGSVEGFSLGQVKHKTRFIAGFYVLVHDVLAITNCPLKTAKLKTVAEPLRSTASWEVDKMKPEEKKMIYTFLDAFITKTKLQTLL